MGNDVTGREPVGEFANPDTTWIQTHMNRKVTPLCPDPETLCIEDIVHALSNVCRYTGHVSRFYSVAQHCVLVSWLLTELKHEGGMRPGKQTLLEGLMHDASEAYLVDVPSPLKPHFPGYLEAEARLEYAVALKFGLPHPMTPLVKLADKMALMAEVPILMGEGGYLAERLTNFIKPETDGLLSPQTPVMAKDRFLARFRELGGTA